MSTVVTTKSHNVLPVAGPLTGPGSQAVLFDRNAHAELAAIERLADEGRLPPITSRYYHAAVKRETRRVLAEQKELGE